MKNIFLIALLLFNFGFYAQGQRGGNGGGRQQQNQNGQRGAQREVKEFKASDVAGIFYYDVEKVIKKLKIKNDDKAFTLTKALQAYNTKVKEIAFLNSEKFNDLNEEINSLRKSQPKNQQNDNSDDRKSMREKIGKVIRPIRKEIEENETKLNTTFKEILSEKQNNKWIKYQTKIKESLQPEKPNRKENGGQSQRGNGQQRRF